MSEWKEYKLGEVVNFQRGFDLPKDKMRNGEYPVAGSNGVIGWHSEYTTKGPGVTIGRSGNIGTPHFYKSNYWAHNTSLFVKDFKGNDPLFIYYFLKTIDFKQLNTGSAVPTLNRNHVHDLQVLFPPIEEQKRIAGVLSSLDDKIDLLHRENATLEALAETLFRHYFIENPNPDWKEGKVSDIAIHCKDSTNPQKHSNEIFLHYSIPAYDNGKRPTEEQGQSVQSNKYVIPRNCILFSKLNPHKDKRVWLMLDDVQPNAICSTEFQIVKPQNDQWLYFLYEWLTYKENYDEIASGVSGTSGSHQRIDSKVIFENGCPIVDDFTLEQYNTKVKPVFEKIKLNQLQIFTLTVQQENLLPRLISGEVKVIGL